MHINRNLDDPHVDPLTAYKEWRDLELELYYEERRKAMGATAFGEYLKQLRKVKGFGSSHKLAEASGVSQPLISQIELGKRMPSPDVIRKLSQALGVTHIGMMIMAGHVTQDEVLVAREKCGITEH